MTPAATPANPYPGLRAFEAHESDLFFGRERETDELRKRLRTTRLLAVVGGSGSGKSSLVRSGLIPSLHRGLMSGTAGSWRVAIIRPGEDPIGNLAAALDQAAVLGGADAHADTRRTVLEANLRDSSLGLAEAIRHARLPAGDNVLVLVDQFEELFRFWRSRRRHQAGDDAAAFVKLLLEAARCADLPIYVVLTMRSEFIGECMEFSGLPEAINAGQYLVPAMSRDALRAAIAGPAAVRGATIAPRLLARLLNEVGNDRDRLPVLQHALMRTWEAWSGDHAGDEPLDVRHYEAIGTMTEALSRHADEAYAELDGAAERAWAERLFKTLTETTEDGHGVRRERAFGVLTGVCNASPAELTRVIDRFRAPARAFLQPPAGVPLLPDTIIDISHESLMRVWTRLIGWVEEEGRSIEIYRRLARGAAQHAAGEAGLWRPPELALGLRWFRDNQPSAAWAGDGATFEGAMSFLRRSRRAHRLRLGLAAGGAALLVAIGIGWFALDARRQRGIAEDRRLLNVALTAEVTRLTEARAAATQARDAQSRELQELRTRNVAMKAEVAAEQQTRSRTSAALATLREGNRDLENRIERLNAESVLLEERNELLNQVFSQLDSEARSLTLRVSRLEPLPAKLLAQAAMMEAQVEVQRKRYGALRALVRETERCPTASMRPPPPPPPPPPPFEPAMPPSGPVEEVVVGSQPRPPAPTLQDMTQRIDDLARQLAALRVEREQLQGEAVFLAKENTLLGEQKTALQLENRRLAQERSDLEDRQSWLRGQAENADAERAALMSEVAANEARNERTLDQVSALSKTHEDLEDRTVEAVSLIESNQREAERLRAENQRLAGLMTPHVERLLQAARGAELPADLAALLAVKAQRWAPYDTDDAAQPAVYNTLWMVLRRVDEPSARAILAPGDLAAGRVATTSTAALVEALCRHVSRPLTELEWRRFAPEGACFTPRAAQPCER